jgi:protein-tyrosine phosphatase
VSGYVDIHAHVLPGIDDGPSDLDSGLAMLRAAAASGIAAVAATPHLRSDFPRVHVRELASRCQELRDAGEREGIEVALVSGAETSVSWALEASDEDLRLASYGQRGRDLLIETPATNVLGLDQILYDLRVKGYRITLAHPERNAEFRDDVTILRALVDDGVLLQINAESLLGSPATSATRRFARDLCRAGLGHVLASDGHRAERWRPITVLPSAIEAAAKLLGTERAHWMADNAAAIVAGTEISSPPAIVSERRWRLFGGRRPR